MQRKGQKELSEHGVIFFPADTVKVCVGFRIQDGDDDAVGIVMIITNGQVGSKTRKCGRFGNCLKCCALALHQKAGVRHFFFMQLIPEADAGEKKYVFAVKI